MNSTEQISVIIAEDHAVVRSGLAALINLEEDMTVVAEAENGKIAVDLYRQHQPDIMLIDLQMPELDGVGTIAQIRAEFPKAKIIILTTYEGDEDIYRGLKSGAKGYLLKDVTDRELIDGIRTVYDGRRYIPFKVAAKLAERMTSSELTEREIEVIRHLVGGGSNQEIAQSLSITEGTVKFHVNNILKKLEVKDRTSAVIVALKRGLARLD